MNAADYQQARFERLGDRIAELKAHGVCSHGWLQTPPGNAETICLDCGAHFQSFQDAIRAGSEIIKEEA